MIRVNDNYNNAIYESRSFTFSVLLNGNEQLAVRQISNIEIVEIGQSDKSLKLGQLCNNQLTMDTWIKNDHIINGYIEVFASLNGNDSMKVPLGKYYVNEYKDNHDSTYTITAYALHPRMNEEVKNINSKSVQTIISQIERYIGMRVLDKGVFTLQTIEEIEEHVTYKQLLADIAGYDGYNLRTDRKGNIVPYKYSMDVVDSSGNQPDIVFNNIHMPRKGRTISSLVTEKKVSIDSVKVSDGKNAYIFGAGKGISYVNPYITADNQVPSYICNMDYVPLTVTDVGNPCREIGDRVSFTDNKGNTFETWIMCQKISIDGGLSMQTESYTNSNKLAVTKESPITKAIREANRTSRKLIEEMFGKIAGAKDGYYNFIDGDGNIVPFTSDKIAGFQISNTPTITPTTKGWRFIRGGLYHSSDGFKTHDDFMLNEDGEINVNLIKLGNKTLTETISQLSNVQKLAIKEIKLYYALFDFGKTPQKDDPAWKTTKPKRPPFLEDLWYMQAYVLQDGTEVRLDPTKNLEKTLDFYIAGQERDREEAIKKTSELDKKIDSSLKLINENKSLINQTNNSISSIVESKTKILNDKQENIKNKSEELEKEVSKLQAELKITSNAISQRVEQDNFDGFKKQMESMLDINGLHVGESGKGKSNINSDGLVVTDANNEIIAKFTNDDSRVNFLNVREHLSVGSHRFEMFNDNLEITSFSNGEINTTSLDGTAIYWIGDVK